MERNVASQKWTVFAFNRTTNAPVTGDAANITAKIAIDGGSRTATNDAAPTETEDGYYDFELTQAETNGVKLQIFPESSTSDVQVIGVPGVVFTTAANVSLAAIDSSGRHTANVTQFGGTNITASGGRPEVNTTHWGGTAVTSANVLIDGAITAAKIAADAITDAKVASDVTIASVTGAVGSVTGNVGGIAGTITTLDQLDTDQDSQHATTQGQIAGLSIPSASDIATAVWAAGTRTLTGFGTLVADIWAHASRTLTAFAGFQISSDMTAVKAKTDQLTFTVANKVDATAEADVDESAIATEVVNAINATGVDISDQGLSDITNAVAAIRASVSLSPYRGGKLRLVIGDDRVYASGTQIPWELANASGIADLTTATVTLCVTVAGVTTESTASTVSTATGSTRTGYVEINAADWPADAVAGDGEYQFKFTVGGDTFTLIEGVAELVANLGA